jgi:hypothetical protein
MSETVTLTISAGDPLEFNGVTIRKAMTEKGDYVNLKAFSPDADNANRQYLLSLNPEDQVEVTGRMQMRGAFRDFVMQDLPATPKPLQTNVHPIDCACVLCAF